jgi:prefoldin subunit 5
MERTDQSGEAAQAIAASLAQIELAVREVQPAVEQLGLLISQMSTGIGTLRTARPRNFDPDVIAVFPDTFDRAMAKLEKEVKGSITQLQFYDRLVQHLGHVQDYLSAVAGELANGSAAADGEVWEAIRGKLRMRLISQAQRELLDAVLPPPEGAQSSSQQARAELSAQGTVELF